MGYSTRTMTEMSKRLTDDDIPVLIVLATAESDLSIGAQFALASQCDPAIAAVYQAAVQHKIDFLGAADTMFHMAYFEECSQDARASASAMRQKLLELNEEDHARIKQEYEQKTENQARIQQNGLKCSILSRRRL
jgi:hypothetical protein